MLTMLIFAQRTHKVEMNRGRDDRKRRDESNAERHVTHEGGGGVGGERQKKKQGSNKKKKRTKERLAPTFIRSISLPSIFSQL